MESDQVLNPAAAAVIIGAGPAGLTAAFELLERTILPVEGGAEGVQTLAYHNQIRQIGWQTEAPDAWNEDRVMLVRERRSRIFYIRKFFEYPIRLSYDTIHKLGIWNTVRIGLSYFRSVLRPIRPEHNLEQFFINRFGRVLYRTFFTVIRMGKTCPAYFGTYERFPELIAWLNRYSNLFLIGRNRVHKYDNQDHSMLTAMVAVDQIAAGVNDRESLWALNTEQEYHEDRQPVGTASRSR